MATGQDPLALFESVARGEASPSELKHNMTRDVVLSLFRSRDDNLVLLSSNLLRKIIALADQRNLEAIELLAKTAPNSILFTLLGFVHTLLASESEFRLATIKSLANLLLGLAVKSSLQLEEMPQTLKEATKQQALDKLAGLKKLALKNQTCNLIIKRFMQSREEYL